MSSGLIRQVRITKCFGRIPDQLGLISRRLCNTGDKENKPGDESVAGEETAAPNLDHRPYRFDAQERDKRIARLRYVASQIPEGVGEGDIVPFSRGRLFRYPRFHLMDDPEIRKENTDLAQKDFAKRLHETLHKPLVDYPDAVDFLIIGGGVMGLSIAQSIKSTWPDSIRVLVVDRDFNYTHAASNLSLGLIRQQFSQPINIRMAAKGARFFRQSKDNLSIIKQEPPDFNFHPQGFLFLVEPERAEKFFQYHETQTDTGAYVDMLDPEQLKSRFPWLNTEGIALATLGTQDEGWIDPYPLLVALKGKAEFLGVHFLEAEVFDFNTLFEAPSSHVRDDLNNPMETCNNALIRFPDDDIQQIQFSRCIVCCGAESRVLAEALGIGIESGIRRVPLPIVARKRYVFVFNAPDAPVLDFPIIVDPSGVVCRRDGLGGNFIVTKYPSKDEEPDPRNLDVDYSYFDKHIYPILAKRVLGFQNIKLVAAWAGYCDENVYDRSPIVGAHPYYHNIFWACGFGSHGVQMAPAVGESMCDFQLRGRYKPPALNLHCFSWERMFAGEKFIEELVL